MTRQLIDDAVSARNYAGYLAALYEWDAGPRDFYPWGAEQPSLKDAFGVLRKQLPYGVYNAVGDITKATRNYGSTIKDNAPDAVVWQLANLFLESIPQATHHSDFAEAHAKARNAVALAEQIIVALAGPVPVPEITDKQLNDACEVFKEFLDRF